MVDEIAFQTRRNLAHRALADVIRFRREDEEAIQAAARRLTEGRAPEVTLAPRHVVSAASYALASGRIPPSRCLDASSRASSASIRQPHRRLAPRRRRSPPDTSDNRNEVAHAHGLPIERLR